MVALGAGIERLVLRRHIPLRAAESDNDEEKMCSKHNLSERRPFGTMEVHKEIFKDRHTPVLNMSGNKPVIPRIST